MNVTRTNKNINLKSLELYDDNNYAKAIFESEDDKGNVWEIEVPRIVTPIINQLEFTIENSNDIWSCGCGYIKINNHTYSMKKENDCYFTGKIIKEAEPKDMTIEEIEKKLGYSVRIVNKKNEDKI